MDDRPLMNSDGGSGGGSVHTATKSATPTSSPPFPCSGCGQPIADQYLLKVTPLNANNRMIIHREL